MELVPQVGGAPPVFPAQACQPRAGQRLGYQGIVIHRDDEVRDPAQQWPERACPQHHPAGPDTAVGSRQRQPRLASASDRAGVFS